MVQCFPWLISIDFRRLLSKSHPSNPHDGTGGDADLYRIPFGRSQGILQYLQNRERAIGHFLGHDSLHLGDRLIDRYRSGYTDQNRHAPDQWIATEIHLQTAVHGDRKRR